MFVIGPTEVPELKKGQKFDVEVDYVDLEWHLEHKWFSNKEFEAGFVLNAEIKMVEDPVHGLVRDYSEPQYAEAWQFWQSAERRRNPDAVIAPFQVYSDKAQVNNKLRSVHPVKFCLLNVPYSKRIAHLSTVAYIPVLNKPANVSKATWRLVKLWIHSKVVSLLLDPLKRLSKDGKWMKDPTGQPRHVFTRLASYVLDAPEGADVMMVKGWPSQHPCEVCLVTKGELEQLGSWTSRTEAVQEQRYKELRQVGSNAERSKLSAQYSQQPVPCALWHFHDQRFQGFGSSTRVLGYEAMHNEDLGVFLYIIQIMDSYLRSIGANPASVFNRLNYRHALVPSTGKYKVCSTVVDVHLCAFFCLRGLSATILRRKLLPESLPRAGEGAQECDAGSAAFAAWHREQHPSDRLSHSPVNQVRCLCSPSLVLL